MGFRTLNIMGRFSIGTSVWESFLQEIGPVLDYLLPNITGANLCQMFPGGRGGKFLKLPP